MKILTSKAFFASVLGVVALMGCGGGRSSSGQVPTADAAMPATSIAATEVLQYMAEMQATSSDSTEPRDITLVDLAGDDTAEPGAV